MSVVFSPTTTTLSKGSTYTFQCQLVPNGWGTYGKMGLTFYDSNGSIVTGYAWATDTISFFDTTQTIVLQGITIPQSASTATMYGQYNDENSNFVYDEIKYSFPAPTVAPSNFIAVQDGKHIKFTWTAGSGDGTMSYLVTIGGDTKISGCEVVTGTESTWTDCHDYYNKSVQFKLVYYLNGSPKGSIAYQLNIGTPSASAAIGVTQASKAKQVTVSWSGSYSYVSPTSITFTVTCSGSSGNLYSGGSAGSVAYTPPQYGTSYTYVVNYVVKNTYGDTFTATASKTFSASAPYYTIRVSGKDCVAYVYRDREWVPCEPYAYYSGQWRLCSTT